MSKLLTPEILPFRDDAFVVRFDRVASPEASGAVQAFRAACVSTVLGGVVEIAPALASVLVRFDPAQRSAEQVFGELAAVVGSRDWGAQKPPPVARLWKVPVCFDAEFARGLSEVSALTGRTEAEAVAELLAQELRVLAIGFAPGQPYLGLLPENWNFPRQTELTPKVPAGALVAAVRQLVLFANESPTGWRQVGQTAFRPFQPDAAVPFPLQAGDGVRFEAVSAMEFRALQNGDLMGGARCEVVQ